jgi:pimeloyl-ACP methyl ester carboxylesterase
MFTESLIRVSTVPHVELFVAETDGPAERTLLVIHGGPDWDHSYLREPLDQLAGWHRVLLSDLRGCGRSTWGLADDDYTWDAAVDDLLALLDAKGVDVADVLGFSTGGLIAQRLALAAPHRVRRLVIASSSVLPVPDDAFDGCTELTERLAQGAALAPSSDGLEGADYNRAEAFISAPANVWRPEALAEYLCRLDDVRFSGEWIRGWQAGAQGSPRPQDAARRLTELGMPMLLLQGRQDMTFPASLADEAAKLIPTASAVVLDEAGHMAHVDQPDAWIEALADFLS